MRRYDDVIYLYYRGKSLELIRAEQAKKQKLAEANKKVAKKVLYNNNI
jgi:hypothetical protein